MIEFVLNEFVRRTLLLQLDAAYPHSLPMKTLKLGLCLSGLRIRRQFLEKELAYLHAKDFVELVPNELCPQHRRYKLSVKGIDFLNDERRNADRL